LCSTVTYNYLPMEIRLLVLSLFFAFPGWAQQKVFREYADQHSQIAISEMHRTGIPASIKLAQGLLESNAGRSELATRANNHFGIKCGGDWNGKSFYKEDDDYQNGKLIKSCFRAFSSVEGSYIAHSEFLRNPSKSNRYGFLFNLSSTDYKGWAHGLKTAGYATAPTYAQKLIKIIEDYELYFYDSEVSPGPSPVIADIGAKGKRKRHTKVTLPQKSVLNNSARMVYARADETVVQLAQRHRVSTSRILKYNELLINESQKLSYGERVYLSVKKSRYRGKEEFHYVQENESMYSIAQLYGIKLSSLLSLNRMTKGEEPAIGSQINLKKRAGNHEKPVLKTDAPNILPQKPEKTDKDTEHKAPPVELVNFESDSLSDNSSVKQHVVVQGDTLFNISRRYNVSIDEIKSLNHLSDNTISVGQSLVIP